MSMPNPSDVPSWTVTGQSERDQVTPGSAPVKGQQIFFTTGLGQSGSIFIPYARYSDVNYVQSQIAAMAAQLDAVKNLSSGPGR